MSLILHKSYFLYFGLWFLFFLEGTFLYYDSIRLLMSVSSRFCLIFIGVFYICYSNAIYSQSPSYSNRTAQTHIVEKGQTLYGLGVRYGVEQDSIKIWNNINDNTIYIGQRLSIYERLIVEAKPKDTIAEAAPSVVEPLVKREPDGRFVPPAPLSPSNKPRTIYALMIGVWKYDDEEVVDLDFAHNDAIDIFNLYNNKPFSPYDRVVVRTITENVYRDSIANALIDMSSMVNPEDMMLVFISAHAFIDEDKLMIAPQDYNLYENAKIISLLDLIRWMSKARCPKFMSLDVCHAGQSSFDVLEAVSLLGQENIQNFALLISAKPYQSAHELPELKHGALSQCVIEAFKDGKADYNGDGMISLPELNAYVSFKVNEITDGKQEAGMPINFIGNAAIYKLQSRPSKSKIPYEMPRK